MQTNLPESHKLESAGLACAWVNGLPAEHLSLVDRGIAYGHGVFETICVIARKPQLLSLHLERLTSGCQRLYIPLEENQVKSQVSKFLESITSDRDGILKIIVTAGSGGRGYGMPTEVEPSIILLWFNRPPSQEINSTNGISVNLCETRLARQPRLAGLKHLNRLEQVLARQELNRLGDSVSEGIMLDTEGSVIEGIMSNLFMVRQGVLITPELVNAGVAGVMREFILSNAEQMLTTVQIQDVTLENLKVADEVFVCNSLIGIWPVVKLIGCGEPVSWPCGDVTRRLQEITQPYCFSYD